jgi:hypothetical protein
MRRLNSHRDLTGAAAGTRGAFALALSCRSLGGTRAAGAHARTPLDRSKVRAVCAPFVLLSQRLSDWRARAHSVFGRWHGGAKGFENDVSLCARHLTPYELRPQCAHTIRKATVRASTQALDIKGRRARTTFLNLIVRAVRATRELGGFRESGQTTRQFCRCVPCTLVTGRPSRKSARRGGPS